MSAPAVSRRTVSFAAGLVAVAVAMAPPLEAAAGRRLSAHMLQHTLLVLLAAPLLAAARPPLHRILWPSAHRVATHPLFVLTVSVGGFWMWHLPRLYDAALSNLAVHVAEHGTFLAGALLFWSVVFEPAPRRRTGVGATCALVFAAMVTNIWLAAGLTFSTTPVYSAYATGGAAALSDQQLAGVIMWLPADVVYFVTFLALIRRLLSDLDRRIRPREPGPTATGGAQGPYGAWRATGCAETGGADR
jgi:putative membrane protein